MLPTNLTRPTTLTYLLPQYFPFDVWPISDHSRLYEWHSRMVVLSAKCRKIGQTVVAMLLEQGIGNREVQWILVVKPLHFTNPKIHLLKDVV